MISHGTEKQKYIYIWFGPGRQIQGPEGFLMQLHYYHKALGHVLERGTGRFWRVGSIRAGFINGRSHQRKLTCLLGKKESLDKGNAGDLICPDTA